MEDLKEDGKMLLMYSGIIKTHSDKSTTLITETFKALQNLRVLRMGYFSKDIGDEMLLSSIDWAGDVELKTCRIFFKNWI